VALCSGWDRWGAGRGGRVAEVRERRSAGSPSTPVMEAVSLLPTEKVKGLEEWRG